MKISFKTIGKGIVAGATAIGAAILAVQTKKSASEEVEAYDATLAPIGEAPTEDEKKPEMEDIPAAEAEVVLEEETDKEE